MVKLLVGIDRSAASSLSIVLRFKLVVNPIQRFWQITYQYRVSGLVQVQMLLLGVRLEQANQCILVVIGATPEGKKELVALSDGFREWP